MEQLETERLRLRPWTASEQDLDAFLAVTSDPVTMAQWPAPFDRAGAKAWIDRAIIAQAEGRPSRLALEEKASGRIIGDIGIFYPKDYGSQWTGVYDLGYILHQSAWGKGYATEAARAVMEWAKSTGIVTLHATMATDHTRSIAVAERLGMRRIGQFIHTGNRDKSHWVYVWEAES